MYSHKKNLTFAHFLVNFLALKLIQHVIAIESIINLDTGSYFAINFVTNLAPKLIQHVHNSYWVNKNLDTGSYFAIHLVNFLAPKLIQHKKAVGSIKNLDTGSAIN